MFTRHRLLFQGDNSMPELNAAIRDIPIPRRMTHLPISERGFPVPWFVCWLDPNGERAEPGTGKPDFRVVDTPKLPDAIKRGLCWLCGQPLGKYKAFVIGPMCAVNRVTTEPPSHIDCAEYAVRACPFLTQPRMRRNDKDMIPNPQMPGGIMIERNPGVTLIWTTLDYKIVRDGLGHGRGWIIVIGDPRSVQWFAHGRTATRAEVMESIDSGMPLLRDAARQQGLDAETDLAWEIERAMKLVPAEETAA